MSRSQTLAGLVPLALVFISGCHCIERSYSPVDCCDSWDPVLGSCHECGLCGGDCEGHTPCSYLKHRLTCASGCGEIYWGDWLSDPPARCDPCDNYGNWVGSQCCELNCWQKLASWKFGGSAGKGGGCKGCDSCQASSKGGKGKGAPGGFPPAISTDPFPPEPIIEEASFEEESSDEIESAQVSRRPRGRRFRIRSTRLR